MHSELQANLGYTSKFLSQDIRTRASEVVQSVKERVTKPEFNPQNPHKRERNSFTTASSDLPTCVLWHVCVPHVACTHTHMHTLIKLLFTHLFCGVEGNTCALANVWKSEVNPAKSWLFP